MELRRAQIELSEMSEHLGRQAYEGVFFRLFGRLEELMDGLSSYVPGDPLSKAKGHDCFPGFCNALYAGWAKKVTGDSARDALFVADNEQRFKRYIHTLETILNYLPEDAFKKKDPHCHLLRTHFTREVQAFLYIYIRYTRNHDLSIGSFVKAAASSGFLDSINNCGEDFLKDKDRTIKYEAIDPSSF